MFYIKNVQRFITYISICVLSFSLECFATTVAPVQNEMRLPSRRLLDTSFTDTSSSTTVKLAYVFIVAVVALILIAICRICAKVGCATEDTYSDAVVHAPPAARRMMNSSAIVLPPPPPGHVYNALAPPNSSRSIILSPDDVASAPALTGIVNPSYNPSYVIIPVNPASTVNSSAMFDLPPAYETVVNENRKYPPTLEKY